MKWTMVIVAVFGTCMLVFGQSKPQKFQTVIIQTSAECGDCEKRIEESFNYTKGVKFAELDLTTMKVTVKYNTTLLTIEQLKKQLSDLGYQADDLPANQEAYEKLPACCKAGGMKVIE
jgi:copper chaperone CopZ